jgi:hypothetical protein
MGSRFDALGLPEDLRQWQALGLQQVLGSAPAEPAAVRAAPSECPSAAEPEPEYPVQPRASKPRAAKTPPPETDVAPAATGSWPAPWDAFLQKVCVPSRTVWTYWELAADLSGQADPGRRQLWANMVKALGWPRGSLAFWPLAELAGGATLARADLFWRGVREIGAAKILCFGRRAFMTLFPDRVFRYATIRHKSLEIVVLPEPGQLTGGEAQARRYVWETLRALQLD